MTSRAGRVEVARVAADANVLLSAVTGGAALKVFTQSSVAVVSTAVVLSEVREYLPTMGERYGIMPEALEAQLRLLAVKEYGAAEYKSRVKEAERRIGTRDPDDVGLLALALRLRVPIWSNDRDLEAARVRRFTTAGLLQALGIGKRKP